MSVFEAHTSSTCILFKCWSSAAFFSWKCVHRSVGWFHHTQQDVMALILETSKTNALQRRPNHFLNSRSGRYSQSRSFPRVPFTTAFSLGHVFIPNHQWQASLEMLNRHKSFSHHKQIYVHIDCWESERCQGKYPIHLPLPSIDRDPVSHLIISVSIPYQITARQLDSIHIVLFSSSSSEITNIL